MEKQKLKNIYQNFTADGEFKDYQTLVSGHINDTYLIETDLKSYVLQKLNHLVFPNIPELMNNKVNVSQHLAHKCDFHQSLLHFYPTLKNQYYYQDEEGFYWNMMNFIPDSKVLEKTENKEQAAEAGYAFAAFIRALDDFDAADLYEIIPDFHKMSFRYQQFDEALDGAGEDRYDAVPMRQHRIKIAAEWIQQVLTSREEMQKLQRLHEQGEIPLRVTHNDTKLSNILFDNNDKALAVIDWDTLMPGIIHYDFGDSVRTICSNSTEDETDLDKVTFNLEYYKSYKGAFINELDGILSEKEKDLLDLAPPTITFIMGLRFLTDYLNGDQYYKIKYANHNLDRAANQFTLVNRIKKSLAYD
ncbi:MULTISPECIES: aminoglycoside phosphotransferase family protein [unclassified Lentimicrobium]|uniref:aminoglycoside phosphotransferase family protein n=1 Tax=unclassified Lentimicrobium TaxID=2677434 RepID=UPI001552F407|nr:MULTISPECIES: aminoglycoside phosphotransferase family protein [unclassified Lentimicrobium]NPD47035.1 aminoglycoside phosphotransferase family protein [Lentimicrobium sp. S6]NPD84856.1 aminoglycoside phosphotransferase family protein [Lentimicrobium sp. L6]